MTYAQLKVRVESILTWFSLYPIRTSFIFVVLMAIGTIAIINPFWKKDTEIVLVQIGTELFGVVLDVLIFGVFVLWYRSFGDRKAEILRYKNEIDDFRSWQANEAGFKIAGNVKRLTDLGINKIDLKSCYLVSTEMEDITIRDSDLTKANFSTALLNESSFIDCKLSKAYFYSAMMQGVTIKNSTANNVIFTDAHLSKANLTNSSFVLASFEQARMHFADLSGSDLTGASFKNALLYKTDFRRSVVDPHEILKAKTFKTCLFDEDVERVIVKLMLEREKKEKAESLSENGSDETHRFVNSPKSEI